MKNLPRRVPAAILFVSLILSAPLWLPSLQALAAPTAGVNLNPFEYASAFYILDAGWTSGSLTQQVLAVPQVLAWTPGQKEAAWAAETGFIYGGFRDAETGRIYITEQRNTRRWGMVFKALILIYLFVVLFIGMGWIKRGDYKSQIGRAHV